MKRFKVLLLLSLFLAGASAGGRAVVVRDEPTGDALDQGLWWLYQLQYGKARKLFDQYATSHPTDPTGYFYKTAADWWELAQEMDRPLPEVADRLIEDYQ